MPSAGRATASMRWLTVSSCVPQQRVQPREVGVAAIGGVAEAIVGERDDLMRRLDLAPRQQLPALVELGTFVGRAIAHQRFQGADLFQAFRHAVDVGLVKGGLGVEGSSQGRHLVTSQEKTGPL